MYLGYGNNASRHWAGPTQQKASSTWHPSGPWMLAWELVYPKRPACWCSHLQVSSCWQEKQAPHEAEKADATRMPGCIWDTYQHACEELRMSRGCTHGPGAQ